MKPNRRLVLAALCVLVIISGAIVILQKEPVTTKTTEEKIIYDEDPYADWNYYTSELGGFVFRHPEAWYLAGWRDGQAVDEFSFNGREDKLEFTAKSNLEITEDNFKLLITINSRRPDAAGTPYSSGTSKKLVNGLTVWKDRTRCPTLRTGTDNSFSKLLENGTYLSAQGGFCLGEGMTTSYSYKDQVSSNEWATAEAIIASIED